MDPRSALEAIEAIRSSVPETDRPAFDSDLAARFGLISEVGEAAVAGGKREPAEKMPSLEETRESLRASFDTAYQTYRNMISAAVKERNRTHDPRQWLYDHSQLDRSKDLRVIDEATIKTEVDSLLANDGFMAELHDEIMDFSLHPVALSPAPGFDLVILPNDLTGEDMRGIMLDLQARLKAQVGKNHDVQGLAPEYSEQLGRQSGEASGYRIVIAPRHYNVPLGTAGQQKAWMNLCNQAALHIDRQPPLDSEVLAQINNLLAAGELNDPKTNFHKTCFRRWGYEPDNSVLFVDLDANRELRLEYSVDRLYGSHPARAILTPRV